MLYRVFCFLIFLCSVLEGRSIDRINQNNDHQLWCEEIFERDLSEAWSYKLRGLQCLGADYQKLYSHEYEGFVYYELTTSFPVPDSSLLKSVVLGPGYGPVEHIQGNTSGERQWVWFHRLLLENTQLFSYYDWELTQRNRLEYRIYSCSGFENHFLYRCRIQLFMPWKFTAWQIRPYLSNEWFFRKKTLDDDDNAFGMVGGWYQNRFKIGMNFRLDGKIPLQLYWQWRILKLPPRSSRNWDNTYQIGLQLYL